MRESRSDPHRPAVMGNLVLNIGSVLDFFDNNQSISRHSNAIKSVLGEEFMFALLIEYFERSGIDAKLVDRKCTTGKPRGPRLDGWVKAQGKAGTVYYQVEVKLWSAHGVGSGARFLREGEDLATYKRKLWDTYWSKGKFIEASLNKVLTPMACVDPNAKVKPLACLWSPVHPNGSKDALFEQRLEPSAAFPAVSIFSASSFLRNIQGKEPTIKLHLPDIEERLRCLKTIFTRSDA